MPDQTKIIKDGAVVSDEWHLVREETAELPAGPCIVPLARWQAERDTLSARNDIAVWLASDQSPRLLGDDIGKLPLIAVDFPGFADGRGLAAALALGADGINMGTRFCVTQEAPIHPNFKQQMVDNDERDTKLIFRTLHNTARVMKNAVSSEVVDIERKGGAKFEDIQHLVAGVRGSKAMQEGDPDGGIWSAGQVQGLIDDIPTVQDLIDRIIAEAETVIKQRMGGMLA